MVRQGKYQLEEQLKVPIVGSLVRIDEREVVTKAKNVAQLVR